MDFDFLNFLKYSCGKESDFLVDMGVQRKGYKTWFGYHSLIC